MRESTKDGGRERKKRVREGCKNEKNRRWTVKKESNKKKVRVRKKYLQQSNM